MGWQYIPYQIRFLFIPFSYLIIFYVWAIRDHYRIKPSSSFAGALKDTLLFPAYLVKTRGPRRGAGLSLVNIFMLFMIAYLGWFSTTKTFLTDKIETIFIVGEDSRIPVGVKPLKKINKFKSGDDIYFIYENLVPFNEIKVTYEVYSVPDDVLVINAMAPAPLNWTRWKQAMGSFKVYGRGSYRLKVYINGELKSVKKFSIIE